MYFSTECTQVLPENKKIKKKGIKKMDNNNSQRPRKRVSRKTIRNRQLAALCVIALIVLILIILIANACSKDSVTKGGDTSTKKNQTTTSASDSSTVDPSSTTTTTTTTPAVTEPVNTSGFKLDMYSVYIDVGQAKMPRVLEYPSGSVEADERWSSSDESIATVSSWGNITGVAPGECYVTLKSAADPSQEVMIKVVVADNGALQQTSNTETTENENSEPQPLAEAPAPPRISMEGVHYEGDTLIVNKTYSLPSSYNPGGLEATTQSQFQKLCAGAAKDGINIYLSSGYRSYDYQSQIYNNYTSIYGTDTADTFSARPGHSEHQTGLAIDVNIIDDTFIGTPEAIWLAEHCHEYGFIIRYPQGKQHITGYKYEPWHIRYVGTEVSNRIHALGDNMTLEELFNIDSNYQ